VHGCPWSATRKDFFTGAQSVGAYPKGSTPSGSGPVTSFVIVAEEGEFRNGDITALTDRNAGDI